MARKKKAGNGGSRRQGIFSWATSVIALGIGLSDVVMRFKESGDKTKVTQSARWEWFTDAMCGDYTGYCPGFYSSARSTPVMSVTGWTPGSWDIKRAARGYAPIGGAYAFKKGTGMLLKTANVKSLIPRLR